MTWLADVRFDADGLVPVIAQDAASGRVLMVAWANHEALTETAHTRKAVYWSRSSGRLWRKGEESGHVQQVAEIRLDCDGDVVLYAVEQAGELPHGRELLSAASDDRWETSIRSCGPRAHLPQMNDAI
jgi:phosphoribosyl-AMP cyclohydrolase